jgi:hypothetical protein
MSGRLDHEMRRLVCAFIALSMALAVPALGDAHASARRAAPAPTKATKKKAGTQAKLKTKVKAKSKTKGRSAVRAQEEKPPPMVGGRVAVFTFKGEEPSSPVRAEVVNVLRSKGLNVMTTLLPVDSAEQYRDMAATLGLAAYVHGEVRDSGERAKAVVHIRSGVTGRKIKSARFSGASSELSADVAQSLWSEVGLSFVRACADAAKPRKGGRAPMRIEAGTPLEPSDTAGGT